MTRDHGRPAGGKLAVVDEKAALFERMAVPQIEADPHPPPHFGEGSCARVHEDEAEMSSGRYRGPRPTEIGGDNRQYMDDRGEKYRMFPDLCAITIDQKPSCACSPVDWDLDTHVQTQHRQKPNPTRTKRTECKHLISIRPAPCFFVFLNPRLKIKPGWLLCFAVLVIHFHTM